jgi:hypothetical protein
MLFVQLFIFHSSSLIIITFLNNKKTKISPSLEIKYEFDWLNCLKSLFQFNFQHQEYEMSYNSIVQNIHYFISLSSGNRKWQST